MPDIRLHDIPLGTFLKYFTSDDYSKESSTAYYDNACVFYKKKADYTVNSKTVSYYKYSIIYMLSNNSPSTWIALPSKTKAYFNPMVIETMSNYDSVIDNDAAQYRTGSNDSVSVTTNPDQVDDSYAIAVSSKAVSDVGNIFMESSSITPFQYEYLNLDSGHCYSQVVYDSSSATIYDASMHDYFTDKSLDIIKSGVTISEIANGSDYMPYKINDATSYAVYLKGSVIGILYKNKEIVIAKRDQLTDAISVVGSDGVSTLERYADSLRKYSGIGSEEALLASKLLDGTFGMVYDYKSMSFCIGFAETASCQTLYTRKPYTDDLEKSAYLGYLPDDIVSGESTNKSYTSYVRNGIIAVDSSYGFRDLGYCSSYAYSGDDMTCVIPSTIYVNSGEIIRIKNKKSGSGVVKEFYGKVSSISASSSSQTITLSKITVGTKDTCDFVTANLPLSDMLDVSNEVSNVTVTTAYQYDTSKIASVMNYFNISGMAASYSISIPFEFSDIVAYFGTNAIPSLESGSRGSLLSEYDVYQRRGNAINGIIDGKLLPGSNGSFAGDISYGMSDSLLKMDIICNGITSLLENDQVKTDYAYPAIFNKLSTKSNAVKLIKKDSSSYSDYSIKGLSDFVAEARSTPSDMAEADLKMQKMNAYARLFDYYKDQTDEDIKGRYIDSIAMKNHSESANSSSISYSQSDSADIKKNYKYQTKDIADMYDSISSMIKSAYSESYSDAATYMESDDGSGKDVSIRKSYERFIKSKITEAMKFNEQSIDEMYGNTVPYVSLSKISADNFESIEKKILSGDYSIAIRRE
jgi:hypothetical protein